MEIKKFGMEMAQELKFILGSEYTIEYQEITKNNSSLYHALLIRKENENIAPTIYIDGIYKEYEAGISKDRLVKEILKVYKESAPQKPFDASFFTDFSNACTYMTFKVVNYEKNKKYLLDVPYKRLQDMAMVPICLVKDEALGEGNIVIKTDHLRSWEISFDELWENVFEYAAKTAPVSVDNIFDIVKSIDDRFSNCDVPNGMLVVSNKQKVNGASAIFYPGELEKMATRLGGNLVILPSSVHETIVFSAPEKPQEIEALVEMVREVNRSVLCEEDILSENVYFYAKESKELMVVGD